MNANRASAVLMMPRSRALALARWLSVCSAVLLLVMVSAQALGQTGQPTGTAPATTPAVTTPTTPSTGAPAEKPAAEKVTLWSLFSQSFDIFTVLLVVGSLAGWTIIIICIIEVRRSTIAPDEPYRLIADLARSQRYAELRQYVNEDDALVCKSVAAAVNMPVSDKNAMREAAELAASEESSRWFRKVEPLNVIGNLGPLLGLAGTVWGMIIAFAALGESGGQANPATLSLGISKALFHTLLGLMLAVPCLTIFGFYRSMVDKLCTRAMVQAADLVEMLPADARIRLGDAGQNARGQQPQTPRPAAAQR